MKICWRSVLIGAAPVYLLSIVMHGDTTAVESLKYLMDHKDNLIGFVPQTCAQFAIDHTQAERCVKRLCEKP